MYERGLSIHNSRICAHIYIYTRTYTHTHTHICIHTQTFASFGYGLAFPKNLGSDYMAFNQVEFSSCFVSLLYAMRFLFVHMWLPTLHLTRLCRSFVHIYTHVYTHICIYIYMSIYIYFCLSFYIYTYVYIYVLMYIYMYI